MRAFSMMGLARRPLSRVPGLEFWKLVGSGTGEGFTPKPNTAVWGIVGVWSSLDVARERMEQASVFRRYRERSDEHWTVFLNPLSARGAWSGRNPFRAAAPNDARRGIVALTRATLKPTIAMQFWRRVPDISRVIGANEDVVFKIGLGEVPMLHQITFSIWPDTQSMAAFARASGPHADAIRAVRDEHWFREELYARFEIVDDIGHWGGVRPLARLEGKETS